MILGQVDDALQSTALLHATQSANNAARESAREREREQWRKIERERERERSDFEAQRRIGMCKRVVARMLKQQLALSWSSFVQCAAERKHKREVIRRVLSRMTHRMLIGAFTCYAGAVETVLARREWVARTMTRWKTSGLKRAMEVWTEYMDMVRSERAQEAQELARQYMQDILIKQQEKTDVARDMERAAERERELARERERAAKLRETERERERELKHTAGLREELKEKGEHLKEKENLLKEKEEQLARAQEERQRTLRQMEQTGLEMERFTARATNESQRARDERGIDYRSRLQHVLQLDFCRRRLWNLRVVYSWKGQATGMHVARLNERLEDLNIAAREEEERLRTLLRKTEQEKERLKERQEDLNITAIARGLSALARRRYRQALICLYNRSLLPL